MICQFPSSVTFTKAVSNTGVLKTSKRAANLLSTATIGSEARRSSTSPPRRTREYTSPRDNRVRGKPLKHLVSKRSPRKRVIRGCRFKRDSTCGFDRTPCPIDRKIDDSTVARGHAPFTTRILAIQ